METPKSAFRSSSGEQSRRRIDFGSKQLSEDSGLCIDSPLASSTPDCGVRKGSAVVASPKCYRRQERRSCFDRCYFLLWFCENSCSYCVSRNINGDFLEKSFQRFQQLLC